MTTEMIGMIVACVVGWIATIFGIFAVIPQTLIVYKKKDTASLSMAMYIIYFVGCAVWLVWTVSYFIEMMSQMDVLMKNGIEPWVVILANTPNLFLNSVGMTSSGIILYFKVTNVKSAKKLGITERECGAIRFEKDVEKRKIQRGEH